jgi:hypothetical protein
MSVKGIIVPSNRSSLTQSEADNKYLKLTGGTLSGLLTLNKTDATDSSSNGLLSIRSNKFPNSTRYTVDDKGIIRLVNPIEGNPYLYFNPNTNRLYMKKDADNSSGIDMDYNTTTPTIEFLGTTGGKVTNLATPTQDDYAANKAYVDTKATKYNYTHTIPVSAWQKQTDGSYKCTRTISGIAETDTPYINLEYQTTTTADQTNEKTEYSKIGRAVTATNSITFTCFSSAPTITLTLNIQGTRGANSTGGSGTLAIANGGTGATTATDARTNLGAAPAYSYGTEDLVAGTSPLAAGTLYFVYE